jgi:dipeptidyl aminopeptidase/acylaminoacyl peptidase
MMKLPMKNVLLPLLLSLLAVPVVAQQKDKTKKTAKKTVAAVKKPLNHGVYDFWKDITEKEISNDGLFFVYGQNPQEGDGKVIIRQLSPARVDSVPRGSGIRLTQDSEYAVFKIKPQARLVTEARRAKKKKDELPKDSLAIYALKTGVKEKIPSVLNFKIPEKSGSWLAYQIEPEAAKKEKKDSTAKAVKPPKAPKKANEENGYALIVKDLKSGQQQQFGYVKEYAFSENGRWLAFATTGNDSASKAGVYIFDTETKRARPIHEGQSKQRFSKISFAKTNDQLAFIADADTNSKTQIRLPKLYYWKDGADKAQLAADESTQPGPAGWLISANRTPEFSKDGTKLFFGTNPKPIVADTTLLPEEIVNVEVWHWQDRNLQTRQKVTVEQDKKRSYLAVFHVNDKRLVQLAGRDLERTDFVNEGNADYILATSDQKYSHEHWDWNPKQDVYLISVRDGSKKLIKERLEGNVRMSPEGKYAFWFSNPDTAWFAYDVAKGQTIRLTTNKTVSFTDEEDDHPDYPNPYGVAGWTKGDEAVLINDRYDIWQVPVTAPANASLLTRGRAEKRRFRYVQQDREERGIDLSQPVLLSAFQETTKKEGYYRLDMASGQAVKLHEGDFKIGRSVLKPKNNQQVLFTKETFKDYPEYYTADPDFKTVTQLTTTNPQQQEYLWGSVELVSWTAGDGTPLQGLLYKPENFDPAKKYPMMVYYYEKNTDNLHAHITPKPIRSYINFSYFTSNGYVVFVPDIVYQTGYPGQSAYNCLIPGVLSQLDKGFVDKERIGISGHSWGGYQTAYLIGQTSLFRAAEAGAPVSNMTSAYGGIRWDTGLVRQAQYERTQTRIGGTLWEKPMQFIENSPLFYAPKVKTPVLVMHNDDDGAVPWYQGIEYYMALKRLGKPVWMLNYNGEKHGLGKRQNMKDFTVRLYQYFDYYLKDAPMPSWLGEGLPYVEKGINQHLELMDK